MLGHKVIGGAQREKVEESDGVKVNQTDYATTASLLKQQRGVRKMSE